MSKIQNLEFAALTVSGSNYLEWALDVKILLESKGLANCISADVETSKMDKFKTIAIIRHHIHETLKKQYLTIEDPQELWAELKNRYDHHKKVLLPKAQYDWKNLRLQDFKSVDAYNSALFEVVSVLKLCDEKITDTDLLEKTFSTFHPSQSNLMEQYRERKFKTYAELVSCLLYAEKNRELLMLNSEIRPPGVAPLPEANKAEAKIEPKESNYAQNNTHHGRSHGRRNGRGRGRRNNYQGRGDRSDLSRGRGRSRGISKPPHSNSARPSASSACHRCGMTNHWAKSCRTSKHLIDLYQEKLKKNPETNLVLHDDQGDVDSEKNDLMDFETSDCLKGSE